MLMKRKRSQKAVLQNGGFTLIEIIIVLLILAVLVAVAVPSLVGYIDNTKAQVCETNRRTLERYYEYFRQLHPEATLASFMAGDFDDLADDIGDVQCPSGGIYSVEDGHIVCSVHGALDEPENNEGADDDPVGYDIGVLAFTDVNGNKVYLSGNLDATKEDAANNYGKLLSNGDVYQDETGIYVVVRNPYVSATQGENDITLADYNAATNGLLKIDTTAQVLTTSEHNGSTWTTAPTLGSLYYYEGNTYICAYPSGQWTSTDPTSDTVWIKLNGQDVG